MQAEIVDDILLIGLPNPFYTIFAKPVRHLRFFSFLFWQTFRVVRSITSITQQAIIILCILFFSADFARFRVYRRVDCSDRCSLHIYTRACCVRQVKGRFPRWVDEIVNR